MRLHLKQHLMFGAAALVVGLSAPAIAQEIDLGDFGQADVAAEVKEATGKIEVISGTDDVKGEVLLGEAKTTRPEVKGRVGYIATKKPLKKTSKSYVCTNSKGFKISKKQVTGEHNVKMQGSCKISIKNAVLEASAANLLVQGSGEIEIKKSTLKSEDIGIAIQGSGDVYLSNVDLTADVAVLIQGSGNVYVKNSRLTGRIIREGTGKVIFEDAPSKAKSK